LNPRHLRKLDACNLFKKKTEEEPGDKHPDQSETERKAEKTTPAVNEG